MVVGHNLSMPGPDIPEHALRALVRQRIKDRSLPVLKVTTLVGGYGHGQACSVCVEPIHSAQVEYEVPVHSHAALRFHIKCFSLWQLECAERLSSSGGRAGVSARSDSEPSSNDWNRKALPWGEQWASFVIARHSVPLYPQRSVSRSWATLRRRRDGALWTAMRYRPGGARYIAGR